LFNLLGISCDLKVFVNQQQGVVCMCNFIYFLFKLFKKCYYYLQFENVSKSKILLSLPCVRIEVLNQTRQEMSLVIGESVCQLVLEWIKRQCDDGSINMDQLTEKVSYNIQEGSVIRVS
jgi:hypothetical protein